MRGLIYSDRSQSIGTVGETARATHWGSAAVPIIAADRITKLSVTLK
jgi:hypothetical protein